MADSRLLFLRHCSALAASVALLATGSAWAADPSSRPAGVVSTIDRSGFYLGGQIGQAFSVIEPGAISSAATTIMGVSPQSSTCQGGLCDGRRDALTGGLLVGFNKQYADGSLLGVEADFSYSGLDDNLTYTGAVYLNPVQRLAGIGDARLDTDFIGTLRLRTGYAIGRFLPFVTAGVAVTYSTTEIAATLKQEAQLAPNNWVSVGSRSLHERTSAWAAGWTAGGGLEYAVSEHWSAKLDYLYVDLITSELGETPPKLHLWRTGISYRF